MNSELIHRGPSSQTPRPINLHYPKSSDPPRNSMNPLLYILREQRFLFMLVGIALATLFFSFLPSHDHRLAPDHLLLQSEPSTRRVLYDEPRHFHHLARVNVAGKVPLGLKRKTLRILVTGGAGFVGSHLVDRLIDRGDSVIVADNFFTGRKENLVHHFGNPRFELIRHDVVEGILLEVDQIYHLACPASPVHYKFNPVKTIKTNVVGTLNMLGLAKRVGARFLLTSTSEVYGDPLQHPQAETYWGNVNPIGVRSCYDEGKRTAETLSMDYHRGLGIEVRIARIFNTYGPRMCIDDGRVVSNFVAQALRKEPLTVYGDGKQTRSFQYVSDLVEGLIRLMEGEHVGPFNLGNPGEFTMLELAQVVQETIDPNAKIEFRPNTEDDPHKRKPDITKAQDLLGWQPTVSLRKGLPLMVEDFRQRIFGDQKDVSARVERFLFRPHRSLKMPRYDDRYGSKTRLYVGRLSSRTRSRDLERLFSRYGRVRDVDMKRDYAFVEFGDPRDADDAQYSLDGRDFDGSRIIVEFAKGGPRGSREYLGRGPPPGSGRCFNCGIDGHWARDCKAGDWKNKCYRCGERGHIEKNCKNSPKKLSRRGRSYSLSPAGSLSPRRGRSRSGSYSRGRSYSRSRSPVRRERSLEREERSRSPRYRSPEPRKSPPISKRRERSLTPDEGSPQEGRTPSPKNGRLIAEQDGSNYSDSPRRRSRSPFSPERESPVNRSYPSPDNGPGRSASPNDDRSPVEEDADNHRSLRDSPSP